MPKQFYFLLFLFFSVASCNGQVNPKSKEHCKITTRDFGFTGEHRC
jgi:hypothetical protein